MFFFGLGKGQILIFVRLRREEPHSEAIAKRRGRPPDRADTAPVGGGKKHPVYSCMHVFSLN